MRTLTISYRIAKKKKRLVERRSEESFPMEAQVKRKRGFVPKKKGCHEGVRKQTKKV